MWWLSITWAAISTGPRALAGLSSIDWTTIAQRPSALWNKSMRTLLRSLNAKIRTWASRSISLTSTRKACMRESRLTGRTARQPLTVWMPTGGLRIPSSAAETYSIWSQEKGVRSRWPSSDTTSGSTSSRNSVSKHGQALPPWPTNVTSKPSESTKMQEMNRLTNHRLTCFWGLVI